MRATTRPGFRKRGLLCVSGILASCVVGCGVDVEVPQSAPTTAEVKSWSDRRIDTVEGAIRRKDVTLPGRAKELSRCLDRLVVNVTIGPGSKFGNASEAVEAIRRVIARLDRWYGESLGRPDGESDGDREELQSILDEAREVLRHINVGEQ